MPEIRYRHEIRTYRRSAPRRASAEPASRRSAAKPSADLPLAHNFRLSETPPLPRASAEARSNPASRDESASVDPPLATASVLLYRASRGSNNRLGSDWR